MCVGHNPTNSFTKKNNFHWRKIKTPCNKRFWSLNSRFLHRRESSRPLLFTHPTRLIGSRGAENNVKHTNQTTAITQVNIIMHQLHKQCMCACAACARYVWCVWVMCYVQCGACCSVLCPWCAPVWWCVRIVCYVCGVCGVWVVWCVSCMCL